jgi:high-affinity iron transporter
MATLDELFSIEVFLIVLRETLESAIIISVLLSLVHQNGTGSGDEAAARRLRWQVWAGGVMGVVTCLCLGGAILGVFYLLGRNLWAVAEHYWEGAFSVLASVIISAMGIKILRVHKMQQKWRRKLGAAARRGWGGKHYMFVLPFVTTLREGMEAIVFVGGIGINDSTTVASIANAFAAALCAGTLVGVALYRLGNSLSLRWFLLVSSLLLYAVAAGLLSKGVWNLELQRFIDRCGGLDVSETGHGPGSYDVSQSVWHVNCCNGEMQQDGAFWMVMTAVFGWTNSATVGSVVAYNVYWVVTAAIFALLAYEERHGRTPWQPAAGACRDSRSEPRSSVSSTTPLMPAS